MRVGVEILLAEVPHLLEVPTHEQGRRERQPAAQGLADAEHVRDFRAGPQLSEPSEPDEDRIHDEQRAGLVAALAQRGEEVVGRHARAGSALHGLDDHDARIVGQRPGILAVCASMDRPGQPRGERFAEALEPGRREREQSRPVVRAVERDDAGLARREQRGAPIWRAI